MTDKLYKKKDHISSVLQVSAQQKVTIECVVGPLQLPNRETLDFLTQIFEYFFSPLNLCRKRVIHCHKLDTTDSFPTLPNARSYNHTGIRRYKTKQAVSRGSHDSSRVSTDLVYTTAVAFHFVQQRCFVTASGITAPRAQDVSRGFSPRGSGFCHYLFYVEVLAGKEALRQVSLRVFCLFPANYYSTI